MSFQAGQIVGDYRIAAMAGSGGTGEVYQAEHTITRRLEALKVLSGDCSGEQTDRFLREIQVQASLNHPNIAAVHTAFRFGDDLVLVMELLDGRPLDRILRTVRIPHPTLIGYIDQVLSALEYAHQQGVIHRDVAPANIVFTSRGEIKLTDFGLAKRLSDTRVSQSGAFIGSPHYMSPEQAKGDAPADARSDTYSTGAVLYEVVTGRKLFDSDSVFELLSAQVHRQPVPPIKLDPRLPQALNDIILKAVAKDPSARFQSAREFQIALRSVGWNEWSASARVRQLRYHGRFRQVLIGAASAASVMLLGTWLYVRYFAGADPQPSITHPVLNTAGHPQGNQDTKGLPMQPATMPAPPAPSFSGSDSTVQSPVIRTKSSTPVPQSSITPGRERLQESSKSGEGSGRPKLAVKTDEARSEAPPLPKAPGKLRRVFGRMLHPLKTSRFDTTENLGTDKQRDP
jgi:serine/threonine protein kinase